MSDRLVLTFDIGTQSLRASVFDKSGELLAIAKRKYDQPYFSPQPNWAEQRPEHYFEHLCSASRELSEKYPELYERVAAVAVTCFRDSPLCLDENNRPLTNVFVWLDRREPEGDVRLSPPLRAVLKLIGMEETVKAQYKISVCNWIMERQPEIWKKTKSYVLLPTYINYKLTGVLADSPANQLGHLPFDYKKKKWMKHGVTRPVFDVPMSKLCRLVKCGDTIGTITREVSELTGIREGVPLIATGSDKGCETLGLSVMKKNQAALSFGTSATIEFTSKKYFEPMPFMPAYPAVDGQHYNEEVQIYKGYWLLTWFINEFAKDVKQQAQTLGCSAEELLNKELETIPAGCEGLLLQPYWCAGLADTTSRGSIIGFTDAHTRAHLYRAIIEGINFELYDSMRIMEKRSGHRITELFVAGGGAQSDEICRITADMFGLPVRRIQTHEASSLGAAIAAYTAIGEFDDYGKAAQAMSHIKDSFEPDTEAHKQYEKIYSDIYSKLYPRLKPLYLREKAMKKALSKRY